MGFVAERRMVGPVLQEFLRPADDTANKGIQRIDYLHLRRVEGMWNYVSMDMRTLLGSCQPGASTTAKAAGWTWPLRL